MRKVVAGAMAAAALAWVGVAQADHHTAEAQRKAANQADARSGSQAGPETGPMRADTSARSDERKHPLFEGKNNFDLDGKVQDASKDRVTIQRKELPPATLHVAPSTKVEVDGKMSSADQLKPGQDVKASFNLRGGTAEAVEIKADKLEADDRKEMSERRLENQKEKAERAQDRAEDQQKRR